MRTFSEQEKWILGKIADLKKKKGLRLISLGLICKTFLEHEHLEIYFNENTKSYRITFKINGEYFRNQKGSFAKNATKKQMEIEEKIIDAIGLLVFLKENRLLIEINGDSTHEEFDIVPNNSEYIPSSSHSKNHSYFDNATEKFIVSLLVNKQYIIRQELLDFVDRGFKTEDERHFAISQALTWTGIIVAILIGITSICFSINSANKASKASIRQTIEETSLFNEIKAIHLRELSNDSLFMDMIRQGLDVLNKRIVKTDKKDNNTDTLNTEKKKMKK